MCAYSGKFLKSTPKEPEDKVLVSEVISVVNLRYSRTLGPRKYGFYGEAVVCRGSTVFAVDFRPTRAYKNYRIINKKSVFNFVASSHTVPQGSVLGHARPDRVFQYRRCVPRYDRGSAGCRRF